MDAWTELEGRTFRYQIVSERGSEAVRNRVLRTLLKREQEVIASGDPDRADLTPNNYSFAEETAGPGVRYVNIKPKRKDVLLVDGRMVLSEDGRELLRVEGVLAKNPSFWTSLVNVIRHYARLDGVRVPIATESIAKVKIAGLSRLNSQVPGTNRSTAAPSVPPRAACSHPASPLSPLPRPDSEARRLSRSSPSQVRSLPRFSRRHH